MSELAIIAMNGSTLCCKQTLTAIQTKSLETVQKRLGKIKAQSKNVLGLLVPAKARFGLKNLTCILCHLVQMECLAMAGAP